MCNIFFKTLGILGFSLCNYYNFRVFFVFFCSYSDSYWDFYDSFCLFLNFWSGNFFCHCCFVVYYWDSFLLDSHFFNELIFLYKVITINTLEVKMNVLLSLYNVRRWIKL